MKKEEVLTQKQINRMIDSLRRKSGGPPLSKATIKFLKSKRKAEKKASKKNVEFDCGCLVKTEYCRRQALRRKESR